MPTVSGFVKENGAPVAGRTVRVYRRDTGELIGTGVTGDGVTPTAPSYTQVATEGGGYTVAAGQTVRYGADTRWAQKTYSAGGTYYCNSSEFGGDPAYGTYKSCQLVTPGYMPQLGEFIISVSYTGEVQVVAVDDPSGTNFNDQIFRTTPV